MREVICKLRFELYYPMINDIVVAVATTSCAWNSLRLTESTPVYKKKSRRGFARKKALRDQVTLKPILNKFNIQILHILFQ